MIEINRIELAEIASKKREEKILEFYESNKENIEKAAEGGYPGVLVTLEGLDKELKSALIAEEARLSDIISEVDLELKRSKFLITDIEYISGAVFSWIV